jgi:mannosyltransferase OCH1-like enzyme
MIPKIIHYCWFGNGQMPDLALKCIASWKKYLPEYEMKLWNEDNFDINSVIYVKEAYVAKKYAFVTDYVRLFALYYEGGIYMDTDVEIIKPLDNLLNLPAFSSYESNKFSNFPTGLIASAQGGIWVKEQLDYYDNRHFILPNGSFDLTPNTVTISKIMEKNGFLLNGKFQIYKNDMHCFPSDYFCPMTSTRILKITENTYCIHHFAGSWQTYDNKTKIKKFIFNKILGANLTDLLVRFKRKLIKE